MTNDSSIKPEKTNEGAKADKAGDDGLKAARTADNDLIQKQRLAASQGFSLSESETTAIKQANQAKQNAFALVEGGDVIASAKKNDRRAGYDKQLTTAKSDEIEIESGVSSKRRKEVETWWQSVPQFLREAVTSSGCKVKVIVNAELTPELKKEASEAARGHHISIDELPMFYSPSLKKIIFVDKPTKTAHEQQIQQQVEDSVKKEAKAGVQTYGDGAQNLNNFDAKSQSFANIKRNGWHEMGHSIDQAVLHGFSQRADYQTAFKHGLDSLPENLKNELSYFIHNRDEMFAEIFAIEHTPPAQRDKRDKDILDKFKELIKVMHEHAKVKNKDGSEQPIF